MLMAHAEHGENVVICELRCCVSATEELMQAEIHAVVFAYNYGSVIRDEVGKMRWSTMELEVLVVAAHYSSSSQRKATQRKSVDELTILT